MSRPAESALDEFFTGAEREFAEVGARTGLVERELRFGGQRVCLRVAGAELAGALLGALAARTATGSAENGAPSPSPTAHVSISVWEESACPQGALPVPWRESDVGPGGLVLGQRDGTTVAVQQPGYGAVTLAQTSPRALLHRLPDRHRIPWWERAAPLRVALFWALGSEGRQLVHAGVVGDSRGGALVVGASGSGKTTVALAALVRGIGYLSDDYVLLDTTPGMTAHSLYNVVSVRPGPDATAHSLYRTAKLDDGHLARFPMLADAAAFPPPEAAGEKAVLDVVATMPDAVHDQLPIRAVLVPKIRGGHTRVTPTSPARALLALAPSTVFQMPFRDGSVLSSLGELVRRVPCFSLDVGDDQAELGEAIEQVLDQVAP